MMMNKSILLGRVTYLSILGIALAACSSDIGRLNKDTREHIEKAYADPRLENSSISLIVRNMESGEIMYEKNSRKSLIPASAMKLVTSSVALDLLGLDYKFRTQLIVNGVQNHNVLHGNVIIHGEGDPYIELKDYYQLISALEQKDITSVSGKVIIDDSWFDNRLLGNGWEQNDESEYYSPPISAIMFSEAGNPPGTVLINVKFNGYDRDHTIVDMIPENNDLLVINNSIACNNRKINYGTLNIERLHGSKHIIVSGCLAEKRTYFVTIPDPKDFVENKIKDYLDSKKIDILNEPFYANNDNVIATHFSPKIIRMYTRFLKKSDNAMAEVLVKTIGRKYNNNGSTVSGISVIYNYLRTEGFYLAELSLVDGSGLSRKNYLTTRFITDLMIHNSKKWWFSQWRDSLPKVGGRTLSTYNPESQGTLKGRLQNLPNDVIVYAKTGSMSGVSSISGYVCNKYSKCYVFSFLVNNFFGSIKDIEDNAVSSIATQLSEVD
ncbi:D-alanyl-D-alanine carboxypeptidase/D-alanyl-D-alanine endopeptidase [Serratia fonticola]|uniref:D-alanyl-D-alanine carboxypeptidase/D-alanyl-D-alanine endopeptidase n=1 Tax=Serratia fonticola TaxID=47917 RepID=UPI003BB7F91F